MRQGPGLAVCGAVVSAWSDRGRKAPPPFIIFAHQRRATSPWKARADPREEHARCRRHEPQWGRRLPWVRLSVLFNLKVLHGNPNQPCLIPEVGEPEDMAGDSRDGSGKYASFAKGEPNDDDDQPPPPAT